MPVDEWHWLMEIARHLRHYNRPTSRHPRPHCRLLYVILIDFFNTCSAEPQCDDGVGKIKAIVKTERDKIIPGIDKGEICHFYLQDNSEIELELEWLYYLIQTSNIFPILHQVIQDSIFPWDYFIQSINHNFSYTFSVSAELKFSYPSSSSHLTIYAHETIFEYFVNSKKEQTSC